MLVYCKRYTVKYVHLPQPVLCCFRNVHFNLKYAFDLIAPIFGSALKCLDEGLQFRYLVETLHTRDDYAGFGLENEDESVR